MKRFTRLLAVVLFVCFMSSADAGLFNRARQVTRSVSVSSNGATGAREYASYMNRTGVFRHAASPTGREVIFRSSGVATKEQAIRAWRSSPAHNRLLPGIRDIQCVGGVCVGR